MAEAQGDPTGRCSTRSRIPGCLKGPRLSQADVVLLFLFPLLLLHLLLILVLPTRPLEWNDGQTTTVALRTRDLAKVTLREYMKSESQVPLNTRDHPVSILLVLSSCSRCAQPKQRVVREMDHGVRKEKKKIPPHF